MTKAAPFSSASCRAATRSRASLVAKGATSVWMETDNHSRGKNPMSDGGDHGREKISAFTIFFNFSSNTVATWLKLDLKNVCCAG
jgi:hypothetical protein